MHDRERFKLVAFNTSQQSSPEFLALFDEVHDIYNTSDAEAAEISRQAEVDIAIDINGYTQGARTGIFAYRPGQIQINYLGYPGTMGTSFHDFIVADEYVISRPLERYYTENVLKLPHFFMPYDLTRSQTPNMTIPDRSTYGLPSNTFIYCSFNEFHKITSKALESWMEILRDNDNSVLWIAQRGEITEAEIRGLFRRGNISSDRIIIAHRLQNFDEHLARLSLADLMLDTFPYNSHTTACDAVTAGLPLLTISGQSFASRVSGSLMSSMALGELIARGWDDYIQKAVRLGKNPEYYTMQREALVSAKRRVRNPQAYARSLEHLFETALASVR
jgi:predicted O-linked N-acetylglucosamine transferase (SPINDLY family)